VVYWRQNHRQYPPEGVCDKFHLELLYKYFESRHEQRAWCIARVKQLNDPMYHEVQHQQQRKVEEEEERLAWEAEQQMKRDDPKTWEYHIAKAEEKNKRARAAECEGTTSETWPPP
jgi:hypothetical protein